jgi:multicomponent K+:H+ antiporter subunit A
MTLALIAALPFLGALLCALAARAGRTAATLAAAACTGTALALLAGLAPAVLAGQVPAVRIDWLPAIGLSASLRLDGLALLFAGLILGMGLLIQLYARFYLDARENAPLFLVYLMLFQGAMTGLVLADNILFLLVFWELTSLSSFLLIGWWRTDAQARAGARMALAVTGGGGLAMIAGMLILADIAGSAELSAILAAGEAIRAHPLYLPALGLILAGCFAKSAQVPFHFWLPQAMAAPTPVSAYLHSATMVKAGLFLMARLWPALAGTEAWVLIVAGTGALTMVWAAKVALFRDDLKAILAWSTVSHLGLVTMLLGFGTAEAAVAAMFHIVNHASFKAALFMAAGIVDHAAHTRDIRLLGGLRRTMPVTFALTAVASLSMAGFPPLNGFLSKEMMLEEATHAAWAGLPWLMPLLATAGALLSVAYALRLVAHGFLGAARSPAAAEAHDPAPGLWLAPALLVGLAVAIGLAPMLLAGWIVEAAAGAVTGGPVAVHLKLWHGPVPALFLSLFAIGGGLVALGLYPRLRGLWEGAGMPVAARLFEAAVEALALASRAATRALDTGSLARALGVAVAAMVAVGAWAFAGGAHDAGTRPPLPMPGVVAVGGLLLVAATLALAVVHRRRVLALVVVAVIGLMVSVGFAWLSAPDLALTQIAVEVVTVLLMLLALNFLPAESAPEPVSARTLWQAGVAVAAGVGIAALAHAMLSREAAFAPVSGFHWENAKPGGGGTNAVNVIIVDFRGYDTYGEIIVLGIAALIIAALTEALFRSAPAMARLEALRLHQGDAGDPHPLLMVVATRVLLPFAVVVALYLFLRGHNQPGGGFVAGLVVAIALLMQYMASGHAWATARQRIAHHALIGGGVLVATATGAGAFVNGLPFLTSAYGYVTLPPVETFELATAALFDLGVFLTVLGAVLLALSSLSRLAVRGGEVAGAQPQGIAPAPGGPE